MFTDADWAGSIIDIKSICRYCTYVWENLVTWISKKQMLWPEVLQTEYRAMENGVCELLWIQRVLKDLNKETKLPIKLFCDNKAAISIARNPMQHDMTKHIEVDRHFIKEKMEARVICIPYKRPDC